MDSLKFYRCAVCGAIVAEDKIDMTDIVPTCPSCWETDHLFEIEQVVITRHTALIDLLHERGITGADTPVISHATPDQVQGKHVIGVLPLSLAAQAAVVTEIPLRLTPDMRGRELDLSTLRVIAGAPVTYKVTVV